MISIVIPVYNVAAYLKQCVESVQKLTCDVEILLIDDGSTDGSGELCDELAKTDSRIRVIHQSNSGLSAARNTGICNSTGEYILFLDSDDFLDLAETEKVLSCCSSGADVIVGLYRNYYTHQNSYTPENSPALLEVNGLISTEQFLSVIPKDGQSCYMVAVRFISRRDTLINNQLLFEPGIYHEDEEWTQRLLCTVQSVFVVHAWFYQYRQARSGAITSVVKPKNVWDTVTVMKKALQGIEKHAATTYKREYLSYRAGQQYLSIMLKSDVLDRRGKKEIWRILREHRDQCVPYLHGSLGTLAKILIKLLGVTAASVLLQLIRRFVGSLKNLIGRSGKS